MRLSRGIASVDDPAWKRDTARPFTRGHKPAHSRSARVVMLVSVEMRPPKVGERGWWAVNDKISSSLKQAVRAFLRALESAPALSG